MMIPIFIFLLPAFLCGCAKRDKPNNLELSSGTCKEHIKNFFPDPAPDLEKIAQSESERIANTKSLSCRHRMKYQHDDSVKLVCKRMYNSMHYNTLNQYLCGKFLTDDMEVRAKTAFNVHNKIEVGNFQKYGCAYYYKSGISAVVCAFRRE